MHRWLLPLIAGLSCGFVMATVGITLFPGLGFVAKPFVCHDLLTVAVETTYRPGQWKGTPVFVCGESIITYRIMLASYFVYSAVFLAFFKGLQRYRKK